ncbi:glycerophosphodiester phosphodiesterase [Zhouia amylolytica]|uniref:glycerophosphodiester phosphodiesterase n=1 Tax=Zhouia amylolytica TaxID=376730 RepID=UPI0020CD4493|nr:glycerophosphodiester phosphodiesterase [Zhouia amylolytica]MCQ0111737.1 glycerophosphodiester phosphodiesterase [Zhouia amylolytica]
MKKISIVCLAMVSLFVLSCKERNRPMTIGHRGAAGYETENSIPSIKKAIDLGVDAIEIDVFKIKSGEVVVFHDDNLKRLAGIDVHIEDLTLEDLNKVQFKNGSQIPQLHQVLDIIDNKVRLNIELKGANTAEPVHAIIQDYITSKNWSTESFIISSFKWDELKKMRALDKNVPIAVLISGDPLNALDLADELKAEAINPHYKKLTGVNVEVIQERGFKVYPWTVNNPEDIQLMKDFKVDGIISDYPDRVHANVENLQPAL